MYIVSNTLCYCGWNISGEKLNKESCELRFSTFSRKTQASWSLLCSEQPTFNMLRKSQWFSQFRKNLKIRSFSILWLTFIFHLMGSKIKFLLCMFCSFVFLFCSNELCIFIHMKHMMCLGLPLTNIQGSRIVAQPSAKHSLCLNSTAKTTPYQ